MDATDWFYVIAFSIGLWVLIPRVVRQAIVIERDRLWAWLWPLIWSGLVAGERAAFQLVTGKHSVKQRPAPIASPRDFDADFDPPKAPETVIAAGETEHFVFRLDEPAWLVLAALEASGTKRGDIMAALQVKAGSGRPYQHARAKLDAARLRANRPEWVSERDQRLMEEVGR